MECTQARSPFTAAYGGSWNVWQRGRAQLALQLINSKLPFILRLLSSMFLEQASSSQIATEQSIAYTGQCLSVIVKHRVAQKEDFLRTLVVLFLCRSRNAFSEKISQLMPRFSYTSERCAQLYKNADFCLLVITPCLEWRYNSKKIQNSFSCRRCFYKPAKMAEY